MSPDAYIGEIWRHFAKGAPGLNYIDSHGRWYYKTCRGCRARIRHYSYEQKKFVCGKCGKPWPFEDRDIAKGVVQSSPKVDLGNERMSDIAGKVLLAERFIEEVGWSAKLYVAKVVTGQTLEEMAKARPEEFREYPGAWSRWFIGKAIREARAAWIERLEAAGLPVS